MSQQTRLPFISHSRDSSQFRGEVAQLTTLTVIGDCEAMRFVPNHLQQPQDERVRIKINRLVFPAFHEQVRDLAVTQRGFYHAYHRNSFKIEFPHSFRSPTKLALAAIDQNQ